MAARIWVVEEKSSKPHARWHAAYLHDSERDAREMCDYLTESWPDSKYRVVPYVRQEPRAKEKR